jgi:hypothetical protein
MEIVGFLLIGAFIFGLGWMTGNLVEWVMDYRERRLVEKWIADVNEDLFKSRTDRE